MLKLNPQQVASWMRERAKMWNEFADRIEEELGATPIKLNGSIQPEPRKNPLTHKEFEDSIRLKSGRVADVAVRLNVEPKAIEDLLKQPESKVYAAERGWLKIKQ